MKPPQHITAEGAGWEPGGVGGRQLLPGLTCSPAGGWRRRGRGEGASPRGTCGGAHSRRATSPPSPSPARPQSCAVGLRCPEQFLSPAQAPGRRERAHVHTQRGEGAPNFLPASAGQPRPCFGREGAPTRKEERWGEFPRVLLGGWDYSTIGLRWLESKGIPEWVARVALGGECESGSETRKVAFQAPASAAGRLETTQVPTGPPGSLQSAREPSALGEGRETSTLGVARPAKDGQK